MRLRKEVVLRRPRKVKKSLRPIHALLLRLFPEHLRLTLRPLQNALIKQRRRKLIQIINHKNNYSHGTVQEIQFHRLFRLQTLRMKASLTLLKKRLQLKQGKLLEINSRTIRLVINQIMRRIEKLSINN